MKNTFALINRTPPDVLSLIPNYWEGSDKDKGLIALTHVCRGWRELFTSRPSLWTRLDCTSANKTKTYIERSKYCPLEICLGQVNDASRLEEALILAATHVSRIGTMSVSGSLNQVLPILVEQFSCSVPLLEKLNISIVCNQAPVLPDDLFDGDLSSLYELRLAGVITSLSWRGLLNLTTFELCRVPEGRILLTQLLDFFESAPHLRCIKLHDSIPNSSNAPAERVVSLPHLKYLSITAQPAHSILLNHFSIPAGVSLRLKFTFRGGESPVPSYLPQSLGNLENLCHITTVNLCFGTKRRSVRLNGPSGDLCIIGRWTCGTDHDNVGTSRFLRSLDRFDVSRSRRLAIRWCNYRPKATTRVGGYPLYRTLRSMEDLRTLTLTECNNLPFVFTLNPNKSTDKIVLCPKLEEITLYIKLPDQFHINELLSMAEERSLRGAKLAGITIVSMDGLAPPMEVFQLRKHVSRVECKFDDTLPAWDTLPVT